MTPQAIVEKIVADIESRSMIGRAWEQIPAEKQAEIAAEWLKFFNASPARAAQAGWKLVPIEPTDAMLEQLGMDFDSCRLGEQYKRRGEEEARKAYADVLAVVPSAEPLMADEELILSQLKRIPKLEDLVYVPGLWRCARCKCGVTSQILNVARGDVRANNEPQQCPNGCGPMWRVTERDAGNELADHMNDVRNKTLEQAARLIDGYARSPKATVVHFLGKVQGDIREAELAPKRAAAKEIAEVVRALKGPA